MRGLPWYMKPMVTCKVLNRLANRVAFTDLEGCKDLMDRCTMRLWSKQEEYMKRRMV